MSDRTQRTRYQADPMAAHAYHMTADGKFYQVGESAPFPVLVESGTHVRVEPGGDARWLVTGRAEPGCIAVWHPETGSRRGVPFDQLLVCNPRLLRAQPLAWRGACMTVKGHDGGDLVVTDADGQERVLPVAAVVAENLDVLRSRVLVLVDAG